MPPLAQLRASDRDADHHRQIDKARARMVQGTRRKGTPILEAPLANTVHRNPNYVMDRAVPQDRRPNRVDCPRRPLLAINLNEPELFALLIDRSNGTSVGSIDGLAAKDECAYAFV